MHLFLLRKVMHSFVVEERNVFLNGSGFCEASEMVREKVTDHTS